MPFSDRTNVPTPAHHPSCKCSPLADHPPGSMTVRLPKNDAKLAQRLLRDPGFLTRLELFYKNTTPFSLLRTYLSLGCYYMDTSLQPTTSSKRTFALGCPRRREWYGINLTSIPKDVPSIRFSKNGVPGPFLRELSEGPLFGFIDDSDDVVVERNKDKTYFQLDWPNLVTEKIWFRTYDGTSRGLLAKIIATYIHKLLFTAHPSTFSNVHFINVHPFSPKNISFDALRLFSVEEYGDVLIPTIGLDIKMD